MMTKKSRGTATTPQRVNPPRCTGAAMITSFIFLTFILVSIRVNNGVHCYMPALSSPSRSSRWTARPSMLQLRHVVRSWDYQSSSSIISSSLSSSFYDDFEDFGELGSGGSNDNNDNDEDKKKQEGNDNNKPSNSNAESISSDSSSISASGDDAVMNSLRNRMADLSKQRDGEDDFDDDEEEDEEDEEEEDEDDYMDSGSALPDLEGNTLSSIDDLIGFAQAKAREKAKDSGGDKSKSILSGTWEDENWARSVSRVDESTGETLDFNDILQGGVVLIANPAKFCSDLTDDSNNDKGKKGGKILGGLFDDPFPQSTGAGGKASTNNISPALLAKFGITLPPSPDLGPDRRADLLPVVVLLDRDQVRGCQAVLMNRRTGNLMGDLPPSLFESAEGSSSGGDTATNSDESGYTPHPLSAFMIQPLWWAGSSPGGSGMGDDEGANRGGGVKAIDMIHACPYVNGSVPLAQSDGLYWGGNPVQAQEAMKDGRLEKPLSGFDFKFFIQTTRWLPSQLEQEIKDGTWYLATVSKEVLFRSRDRLGAKRAKPLWTEIVELLGDDYKHIRDQLYGEEED